MNNEIELTPAQKREKSMIAKYGENWRQVIAKKAADTYKSRTTPEERAEKARIAGRIGGKLSPTKFTADDERASRAGSIKQSRTTETRSE